MEAEKNHGPGDVQHDIGYEKADDPPVAAGHVFATEKPKDALALLAFIPKNDGGNRGTNVNDGPGQRKSPFWWRERGQSQCLIIPIHTKSGKVAAK